MGIKRCPNCGNTRLLARKIIGAQVESLENGEFKINAEGSNYQLEIAGCAKCKAEFDESQLVEMVQCKKCGKFTEPENLDANGECDICHALEERPELANMTKEDVLRMYLKMERVTDKTSTQAVQQTKNQSKTVNEETTSSSTAKEKMKAAQAAINNVSNEFSQGIVEETKKEIEETQEKMDEMQQQAMTPPIEDEDDKKEEQQVEKPRRGRPRKKTETNTEEVSEEQVENSANEIAESQEAPFPEQDSEMKEAFDNSASQEETTSKSDQTKSPFQMFDDEQSF